VPNPAPPAIGRVLVVVSGLPGSGKTTLARQIAPALGLPLISKDVIKEALFDVLGTGDLDWSRRLGAASHKIMYALAADSAGAVLESHFWHGVSEPDLLSVGMPIIQVFCRCPAELALARYEARASGPLRHPGHLPSHQRAEATAAWASSTPAPLALEAPLVEVDTTSPADPAEVARAVLIAAAAL